MTATREPIASTKTYSSDAASTGYDVEIYPDYAILTFHSLWQGSRPGTTYKAVPPKEVMDAAKREAAGEDHGHEPDLESAVTEWIDHSGTDPKDWKLIRKGNLIG